MGAFILADQGGYMNPLENLQAKRTGIRKAKGTQRSRCSVGSRMLQQYKSRAGQLNKMKPVFGKASAEARASKAS
jgi:hypothetical protein